MIKSLFEDDGTGVEFVNSKKSLLDIQPSGAFIIKCEDIISDIRLEFDTRHPLFNLYIDRLKKFIEECEDVHVLKSSSGI